MLVVTGEPDVGKSALTLSAVADIQKTGAAVVALSLRDLPPTTVEAENYLGASLKDVLAGAKTSEVRLLVVDGAEAALEGRDDLLHDLAVSALRDGLGVALVTRSDAEERVADILESASESVRSENRQVDRHVVEGLTPEEVSQTVSTFPQLVTLVHDRRGGWLLSHPGLVDLVLRSGDRLGHLDGPLAEVHIFAAVWSGLIRRGESSHADGVSPDDREHALLELARRSLNGGTITNGASSRALTSLRSDGLLISAGLTAAWSPDDEFATDLVRDFALARLMVKEGYGQLSSAGAPRWASRAARLACEVAQFAADVNSEAVRREQQSSFDNIAAEHGARWADIPLEALITRGDGIERAWPALCSNEWRGLCDLVRVAHQRFIRLNASHPMALGDC